LLYSSRVLIANLSVIYRSVGNKRLQDRITTIATALVPGSTVSFMPKGNLFRYEVTDTAGKVVAASGVVFEYDYADMPDDAIRAHILRLLKEDK
jgi:hypothetical protein